MGKNFIQDMHMKKGAFTAKANAAGKSVGEYAQEEKGAGGTVGKEANLAITLRKLAQRRKGKK